MVTIVSLHHCFTGNPGRQVNGIMTKGNSSYKNIMSLLNITPLDIYFTCLQLKKSRSDADERRRKSLLPWSRKARAKSRDRVNFDPDDSSMSSSRSSLTTWEVPLSSNLCRVVLSDGSTAVVHTRPNQTVRHMISRLLDKRALSYSDFQVVHSYPNKVNIVHIV